MEEKISFTSDGRVCASLSLFEQFEQCQSELVEKAPSINSDNSNSNDSFYMFESNKSSSARDHVQNSLLDNADGSLISPPSEDIRVQEYEKHVVTINSDELVNKLEHIIEKGLATDENSDDKMLPKRENRLNNRGSTDVLNKSIVSTRMNKRRRDKMGRSPNKRPRISRERRGLLSENTIELAPEPIEEYNVGMNNEQLYLQPQVGVERDLPKELALSDGYMRIQDAVRAFFNVKTYDVKKTCIVERIDYKKSVDANTSPNTSSKLPENSSVCLPNASPTVNVFNSDSHATTNWPKNEVISKTSQEAPSSTGNLLRDLLKKEPVGVVDEKNQAIDAGISDMDAPFRLE